MCCNCGWPVVFFDSRQVAQPGRELEVTMGLPFGKGAGVQVVCDGGACLVLSCFRSTMSSRGHFKAGGVVTWGVHLVMCFFLIATFCEFWTGHVG